MYRICKKHGVEIPDDYDEETWGPFIKKIIGVVEECPDYEFVYNYSVTLNFANDIKRVVNDYYGRSNLEATSRAGMNVALTASAILMESEATGPWVLDHLSYNCYIYSIGIPERIICNPGWYSSSTFSLSLPISEMANNVVKDLRVLGAQRVYAENTMRTDNLCIFEQIICIRKGLEDYHLMRYNNGNWYHKPGQSAILRYKYTPSLVRLWTNEAVGPEGVVPSNTVYDSEIYYISYNGHDWDYTSNSNGTHKKYCGICDDLITEDCDFSYSYQGNNVHRGTCKDCGYVGSNQVCSFLYINNENKSHTRICTGCYNSVTVACNLKSNYSSNGQHYSQCTQCSGGFYEKCSGVPTHCEDTSNGHKHTTACLICGHVMGGELQPCNFVYRFNGTVNGHNTHNHICDTCSHIKTAGILCFIKGGKCMFCGASEDAVLNPNKQDSDLLE